MCSAIRERGMANLFSYTSLHLCPCQGYGGGSRQYNMLLNTVVGSIHYHVGCVSFSYAFLSTILQLCLGPRKKKQFFSFLSTHVVPTSNACQQPFACSHTLTLDTPLAWKLLPLDDIRHPLYTPLPLLAKPDA